MKRVLLKLSGEALAGENKTGFHEQTCIAVAKQVKKLVDDGVEVGIVIGGGNFWRGRTSETIDRTKADQIGMLATVMNCIYVSEIFRFVGMTTEVFTPFVCGAFTQGFSKDAANAAFPVHLGLFRYRGISFKGNEPFSLQNYQPFRFHHVFFHYHSDVFPADAVLFDGLSFRHLSDTHICIQRQRSGAEQGDKARKAEGIQGRPDRSKEQSRLS